MRKLKYCVFLILLCVFSQLGYSPIARADELPEYRLKTAFLYNFATYTQWPNDIGDHFNLCVYGKHSFGNELDSLQGKKVNEHAITVKYIDHVDDLVICRMVFFSRASKQGIDDMFDSLSNKPILVITDDFVHERGMINLAIEADKVKFDIDLAATRNSGLNFSSQLLRFAREVHK